MPPSEPRQPTDRPLADADPGFELLDAPPAGRRLPVARLVGADRLATWVRGFLLVLAAGFVTVFGIAAWLSPYRADGTPKTMGTHQGLGLPPCSMVDLIGKPCPSCGMTTSFSLLMHGDVPASLRANWAGTGLAVLWLALTPWAIASAVRGKYLFVRSGELLTTVLVVGMLVVMLGRWAVVLVSD